MASQWPTMCFYDYTGTLGHSSFQYTGSTGWTGVAIGADPSTSTMQLSVIMTELFRHSELQLDCGRSSLP
eukprot:12902715-Prorocentrum_lima.AAC.1